jgi:hypothetical protein
MIRSRNVGAADHDSRWAQRITHAAIDTLPGGIERGFIDKYNLHIRVYVDENLVPRQV